MVPGDYVIAAMVVACVLAAYKMQYQALYYLLTVIFGGVTDLPRFLFITFMYLFGTMVAGMIKNVQK